MLSPKHLPSVISVAQHKVRFVSFPVAYFFHFSVIWLFTVIFVSVLKLEITCALHAFVSIFLKNRYSFSEVILPLKYIFQFHSEHLQRIWVQVLSFQKGTFPYPCNACICNQCVPEQSD